MVLTTIRCTQMSKDEAAKLEEIVETTFRNESGDEKEPDTPSEVTKVY